MLARYVIIRYYTYIRYVKFNHKRFAKRFKLFLKLNRPLSVNVEFEIN